MHAETEQQLDAAAFHGERTASRRLAKAAGMTEAAALRHILEQAAGSSGLPALLLARAQRRSDDEARRSARRQEHAAKHAAAQAARQAPPGAWRAWFDGSAHPNPGRLGIGALLLGPAGERVEISRRAGHGNSGEAEYLALEALLEAALAAQPPVLAIYGDSQVVIGDVAPQARAGAGAKGLEPHRERVLAMLGKLEESGRVTLHWVPRHRNGEADRLSQQAIASWPGED